MTKRCPKCNKNKELSKFYKDKSRKLGVACYCKECQSVLVHHAMIKINKYSYRSKHYPWLRAYNSSRQRCLKPKDPSFRTYGAKGIRVTAKPRDFKEVWFRDKAYEMEHPSISRIDHKKNYEVGNMKYEEWYINCGWTCNPRKK